MRTSLTTIALLLGLAPSALANTEIRVCNDGNVDLFVASVKVYDTFTEARAWIRVRPSQCEMVHSDYVSSGPFHLNEGARVNLAFAKRDVNGTIKPHLGLVAGFEPEGSKYRPRIVCIPYPSGDAGWTVNRRGDAGDYLPPCKEGIPVVPVSFSGYIQGEYHLTIKQHPVGK